VLAYRDSRAHDRGLPPDSRSTRTDLAYDPMNDLHGARSEHRLRDHQRDGRREPQWTRPPASAGTETSQHISNTTSYTPSPTYPSRVTLVNAPCEGMPPALLGHPVRQPQRGSV
jgi:hypothetical protein